jgi:serine/threonine protein kinase/Tfp pilus assembly protein PilF
MEPNRTPADRRAAEIIQQWLDGAPPDAEAALAANPDFRAEKAIVLDLAFAEYLIRELKGEKLDAEAYCTRYPDYYASLGRMLAQQSVGDRPAVFDVGPPITLAEQTINTPVTPVRGTDPGPRPKPSSTDGPSVSPPAPQSPPSTQGRRSGSGAWPTPGGRVGDFNFLRQLGKGAFGRVFLAMEEPTSRHVVVKVSRQKCDEAKVLGRLGHRNVVSVLSAPFDFNSGLYLIVMPYHGSATLEDLLELAYPLRKATDRPQRADVVVRAARRNLQPSDPVPADLRPDPFLMRAGFVDGIVWIGVRVAEALAAVHQAGYVHHDLKPSNVLLGLDGQPRVLDFNLASDVRNQKSRLGGTLPYMPPEHLQAVRSPDAQSTMDARGDVYSLGVILYELLTGTHPFGRFPRSRSVKTVAEEMLSRQKLGVRPLRERNPDVPHRLARLVERCLAFNPADRPQTAAAVQAELRHCYSARKRAMQFVASRPGRLAVTAAAIGLFSAAGWMASAQARPSFHARDYRREGLTAVADRRYAEAIPSLMTVTQSGSDDAEVWRALGRAHIAQKEWETARDDLNRAVQLQPGHGPTQATVAWVLAKLGYYGEARVALDRAGQTGYSPAGLFALRGYCDLSLRDDKQAEVDLHRALEIDSNHRAALVSRAQLGLVQAMGKVQPPTAQAIADVEHALKAGPADGYLSLWAARFYFWMAHKPSGARGEWYPELAGAKERCRALLRQAAEGGVADGQWRQDSGFRFLFGEPAEFARDWAKPTKEADTANYWRTGDPLTEFGQ